MPVITLTTDFGNRDYYAGMLKGTMLTLLPGATIVDISNNIQPFNITEAAFVLKNSFYSFPEGSVHVICVNDQDDRQIKYIAATWKKHFFVGFDNGTLSMIFDEKPEAAVELAHPSQNGTTAFLWKNVFAKAACHLAQGRELSELGKPVTELAVKTGLTPAVHESLIKGNVIYVDSFNNLVVNITKDLFGKLQAGRNYTISFRREKITTISESYRDVPEGEMVCMFNSAGYLEIAINSGKASSLLGLNVGDAVLIDFET